MQQQATSCKISESATQDPGNDKYHRENRRSPQIATQNTTRAEQNWARTIPVSSSSLPAGHSKQRGSQGQEGQHERGGFWYIACL